MAVLGLCGLQLDSGLQLRYGVPALFLEHYEFKCTQAFSLPCDDLLESGAGKIPVIRIGFPVFVVTK